MPDDCSILLINGAQKDITKDELKMIKTYMKNGGKMYVFLDARVENLTNLYSLLKSYNVEPQKGVVVEQMQVNIHSIQFICFQLQKF